MKVACTYNMAGLKQFGIIHFYCFMYFRVNLKLNPASICNSLSSAHHHCCISRQEVYQRILIHGPLLDVISNIEAIM